VNEKCDVYSFGVLALEILFGKHPGEVISLFNTTDSIPDIKLVIDMLDQCLPHPLNPIVEELVSIAMIAFACLTESPQSRPTMEKVSRSL